MAAHRLLLALLLALTATLTAAGAMLGAAPGQARAASTVDTSGQFFLSFDLGGGARSSEPRFGLRLGSQGQPTAYEPAAADFTSAVSLSFDRQGRGELSLAGLSLPLSEAVPAETAGRAALGYAPSRQPPLLSGPLLDPEPLVTSAGIAAAGAVRAAAASPLSRPVEPGQALAPTWDGRGRWAFHVVKRAALSLGPRFARLAASMLEERGSANVPTASPAAMAERPARRADVAAAKPAKAADGKLVARGTRWRFRSLEPATPSPGLGGPILASTGTPWMAGSAALLLAPHGGAWRPPALAGGPRPAALDGAAVGQWVFRNLSSATG